MKEFIDKLISRLEEEHERCINRYGIVGGNVPAMEVKQCMEIVNELAEEYKGGWIPCERELPELGQMCLCSVNTEKYKDAPHPIVIGWYTEFYKNRFADWYTAWMPLPAPYTEGE